MAVLREQKYTHGSYFWHWCEGCRSEHVIDVRNDGQHPAWTFNGDFNKPTFEPSINYWKVVCHYFVKDGKIIYCADSTHKFAGKSIPLIDLE